MPHLIYLNRIWRIAPDELCFQSSCLAISRILWTFFLCIVLGLSYEEVEDCHQWWSVVIYLAISIATSILTILCEIAVALLSLRGSIYNPEPRKVIVVPLSVHIALSICQLVIGIYGLIFLCNKTIPCSRQFSSRATIALLYVIVLSQIIDFVGVLGCCYMYSSKNTTEIINKAQKMENKNDRELSHHFSEDFDLYGSRCRNLCQILHFLTCNLFGGNKIGNEIEDVAQLFSNFFHHDGFLDLVPSDIAVGVALVRMQQRRKKHILQQLKENEGSGFFRKPHLKFRDTESNDSIVLDPVSLPEEKGEDTQGRRNVFSKNRKYIVRYPSVRNTDLPVLLTSANDVFCYAHYSRYALSMYSALMYIYKHPLHGVCSLGWSRFCGSTTLVPSNYSCCCDLVESTDDVNVPNRIRHVVGDSAYGLFTTGLLLLSKNSRAVLLYVNFSNGILSRPFGVFYDRDTNELVVAIRGTLSLEDCITDVLASPEHLEETGRKWGFLGKGKYAHNGMLKSAQRIRELLDSVVKLKELQKHIAEDVYFRKNIGVVDIEEPSSPPRLVVVGHSLGAGVAAILSLLLRPAFPELKCYGYGMPGSIFDEETCKETQTYITSIVLNNDLVPRLAARSLCKLREQIINSLLRCKMNKYSTLKLALKKDGLPDLNDLLFPINEIPDTPFSAMLRSYVNMMSNKSSATLLTIELHLPGHVVHLKRIAKSENEGLRFRLLEWLSRCRTATFGMIPAWPRKRKRKGIYYGFDINKEELNDIYVSTCMVSDHLPNVYVDVLDDMVADIKQGVNQSQYN